MYIIRITSLYTITIAKSSRNSSSDDAIIVRSYEAMRSNVSMLSNVTTDHAAPVFLKEIAPAVYSSLLNISMSRNGSVQYGDENRVRDVYRSSSVPVYRLYSHPLPKINYTNQIYIERGYLGATMIVLYMLITTIVSVRAITLMRKNGIKLQLHMAGNALQCPPIPYPSISFHSTVVYNTTNDLMLNIPFESCLFQACIRCHTGAATS